jgi:hypothetical protein
VFLDMLGPPMKRWWPAKRHLKPIPADRKPTTGAYSCVGYGGSMAPRFTGVCEAAELHRIIGAEDCVVRLRKCSYVPRVYGTITLQATYSTIDMAMCI